MDIYKLELNEENEVSKTKHVGYHWFECGKAPEPYAKLDPELVAQNGLPPGEYSYASTIDSLVDSRIPRGRVF